MSDATPVVSSAGPVPANWSSTDAMLAAANAETSLEKILADAKGDLPTVQAAIANLKSGSKLKLLAEVPTAYREAKQIAADAAPLVQAVKDSGQNRVFLCLAAGLALHPLSHLVLPTSAPAWAHALWPAVGALAAVLSAFLTHSANSTK